MGLGEERPEDTRVALLVARRLRSRHAELGPALLAASILVGASATLLGLDYRVWSILSLYPALLGGFSQAYFMIALYRGRLLVEGRRVNSLKLVLGAVWPIPLYYTILGILLVSWKVKRDTEYILERAFADTQCARIDNPIVELATLGLSLALLQACVGAVAASALERYASLQVASESLGAESYDGQEDSGSPNVPV